MPSNTGPGRLPLTTIVWPGGWLGAWFGAWFGPWARVSAAGRPGLGDGAAIVAPHPASATAVTMPATSPATRALALRLGLRPVRPHRPTDILAPPEIPRVRLPIDDTGRQAATGPGPAGLRPGRRAAPWPGAGGFPDPGAPRPRPPAG